MKNSKDRPQDDPRTDPDAIQKIISRNKRAFLQYNNFRKKLFEELTPRDSETILYMLPWLLSINDPSCPGYLKDLSRPFRVFNIEYDKNIKNREEKFKRLFGITRRTTLLKSTQRVNYIQGIYTIGSVGTVSQNTSSDCDIWICFEKEQYDRTSWHQLNQKVNLIKGWMDNHLKLPVYFFISDVESVKQGLFGSVDKESSGSTQENVLKEEFYRTFILVSGKIPVWWLVYDRNIKFSYEEALNAVSMDSFWEYDLIDFGNLEKIRQSEYFGAALWQFRKFLSSPLKSIIKMVLLKMLLEAPQEKLICHQFREAVLSGPNAGLFPDHALFTMSMILNTYKGRKREMMNFLKMCFFLRCELDARDKRQSLKNRLAGRFFKEHALEPGTIKSLQTFRDWKFNEQIEFGNRLFRFMLQLYREISAEHESVSSHSDKKDLTILGRKISASYLKKHHKISILHKPGRQLNTSILTMSLKGDEWQIFSDNDTTGPIFSSRNLTESIAFTVWNNLFVENRVRLRPNSSGITLKEIVNIGKRIKEFFGTYEFLDIELSSYLEAEHILQILIVMGFDKTPWEEELTDYSVVYINNWGELFTNRFNSRKKLETFLKEAFQRKNDIIISKYLIRNQTTFDKNIEIPKKIVFSNLKI
jgi:adenylate cyclase, class 1